MSKTQVVLCVHHWFQCRCALIKQPILYTPASFLPDSAQSYNGNYGNSLFKGRSLCSRGGLHGTIDDFLRMTTMHCGRQRSRTRAIQEAMPSCLHCGFRLSSCLEVNAQRHSQALLTRSTSSTFGSRPFEYQLSAPATKPQHGSLRIE